MRKGVYAALFAGFVLSSLIVLILSGDRVAKIATHWSREAPVPATRLSVDELSRKVFAVSAGRRLKPGSWPNGNRVAVALSFDVDNATIALSRGDFGAADLSRGEYGAIDGLPRILRLLDKHDIPASFFIPAVAATLHPHMISDILARQSHEIGVHGWVHEQPSAIDNEAEERRLLAQSIEYITRTTGRRPVGYRAPAWSFSRYTMQLIKEAGFIYDSSLMASDDPYEILVDRQPTGIIELPVEWILDDYPYFGPLANGSLPSTDLVLETYQSEFDVAYEEGGLYILTMHPHVAGHRSRIVMLDRLINHMKARPGVWFATHEQVANHVRASAMSAPLDGSGRAAGEATGARDHAP
jgi:peptidoglycan/xylan/chitin deacetylase (PgdA/CDA1 family)